MGKGIKAITFDLDDTFWDVKPVLINAELQTRKFIEDKVGKLE
jgi:putative hydrolase of the HAD superfamily